MNLESSVGYDDVDAEVGADFKLRLQFGGTSALVDHLFKMVHMFTL